VVVDTDDSADALTLRTAAEVATQR
jgi:hypothetical protein